MLLCLVSVSWALHTAEGEEQTALPGRLASHAATRLASQYTSRVMARTATRAGSKVASRAYSATAYPVNMHNVKTALFRGTNHLRPGKSYIDVISHRAGVLANRLTRLPTGPTTRSILQDLSAGLRTPGCLRSKLGRVPHEAWHLFLHRHHLKLGMAVGGYAMSQLGIFNDNGEKMLDEEVHEFQEELDWFLISQRLEGATVGVITQEEAEDAMAEPLSPEAMERGRRVREAAQNVVDKGAAGVKKARSMVRAAELVVGTAALPYQGSLRAGLEGLEDDLSGETDGGLLGEYFPVTAEELTRSRDLAVGLNAAEEAKLITSEEKTEMVQAHMVMLADARTPCKVGGP